MVTADRQTRHGREVISRERTGPLSVVVDYPAAAVAVCTVSGEIDMVTMPLFSEQVQAVVSSGADRHLVIDLRGVRFLSAAGLGVLAEALDTQDDAHEVALVFTQRAVARPLDVAEVTSWFACYGDVDAAVAACRRRMTPRPPGNTRVVEGINIRL